MRLALLVFFLHVVYSSTIAQISFGVKGGINLNSPVIKDVPLSIALPTQSETVVGFHIGLFSQFKLSDRFSLIPELQYSQRGAKYNSVKVDVNYLELPVIASLLIKSFAVDFGPQVSHRLSSTADAYRDFDFGFIAGARFNFGKNFFAIGRYYYGITVISEIEFRDANNNLLGRTGEYNRSLQLGIGYKIK